MARGERKRIGGPAGLGARDVALDKRQKIMEMRLQNPDLTIKKLTDLLNKTYPGRWPKPLKWQAVGNHIREATANTKSQVERDVDAYRDRLIAEAEELLKYAKERFLVSCQEATESSVTIGDDGSKTTRMSKRSQNGDAALLRSAVASITQLQSLVGLNKPVEEEAIQTAYKLGVAQTITAVLFPRLLKLGATSDYVQETAKELEAKLEIMELPTPGQVIDVKKK